MGSDVDMLCLYQNTDKLKKIDWKRKRPNQNEELLWIFRGGNDRASVSSNHLKPGYLYKFTGYHYQQDYSTMHHISLLRVSEDDVGEYWCEISIWETNARVEKSARKQMQVYRE